MTDSSLQSLYPVNQIGADGFNWWVGQIEQGINKDPKGSGRCKVRIVGLHPQKCDAVSDEDLPWAITMMPVTNPHSPGGLFSVSPKLESGHWVIGFFLDNDKQQPVILGSVGQVANAKSIEPAEKTSAEGGCNSFTTYLDDMRAAADQPASTEVLAPVTAVTAGHVQDGEKRDTEGKEVITSPLTNLQKAMYSKNTTTNPGGISFCVEKADRCGKDTNLSGTFTNLFAEMLAETQRNNGKLGTYLVGELSGDLYDAIDIGRKYVNKAIMVMKTFIANIKGFVIKQIKKAVKKLTDALLRPSKDGNSLSAITKFLNKALDKVGCSMADLGDRLAKWLEDMIFGYLFNIYKATACQVDKFIGGLINKIQSLMNSLLESILGPLQSLLGAIAAPLDMIGQAINKVLSLLGITCTGPKQKCAKTTKVCTDCSSDKREDFLDKLLKDLNDNDSQDWNQYTCKDNNEGITIKPTTASFVGGIQNPDRNIVYSVSDIIVNEGEMAQFVVTREGYTDVISSLTYKTRDGSAIKGSDYEETTGIVGFVSGEKSKVVEVRTFSDNELEGYEDFFLRFTVDSPGRVITRSNFKKNIARCTIKESRITTGEPSIPDPLTPTVDTSNPNNPISNPDRDPFTGNVFEPELTTTPTTSLPTYRVVSDKVEVKEGDFVTYTITTTNIPDGTRLGYQLFGPSITPSDITSNNLTGSFDVTQNEARVVVGIKEDNVIEDEETLTFAISGTGASTSVIITSNLDGLSEEEISNLEDLSSDDLVDFEPKLPTIGTVITDNSGGIIDIPVDTPGTRYTEPPTVFITGEGYGADAEALLDTNGFVTEIRVTDPGFGYKINEPTTKECIIDAFTMIRPGRDYTSAPTVYINGRNDVAEAVINTKGQITSIRIKDRSSTFTSYPEVKILGGGGYGAKFIPAFKCLDPAARVKIGSAKIGTGSYIDCP